MILRFLRRLRGTPFDVFGHSHLRRVERELVTEYRAAMEKALSRLCPNNRHLVTRIAALPDRIRGYERLKLDNVARYRLELQSLLREMNVAEPL